MTEKEYRKLYMRAYRAKKKITEEKRLQRNARVRERRHQRAVILQQMGSKKDENSQWQQIVRERNAKAEEHRIQVRDTVESFMERFRIAQIDPEAIKLLKIAEPDKEWLIKRVNQYDRIEEQLKTMDPLDTMKNALNYKKECIREDFQNAMSKYAKRFEL